jgi:hypothetical protein
MVAGGDVISGVFIDVFYLARSFAVVTNGFTALIFTGFMKAFSELVFRFSFLA